MTTTTLTSTDDSEQTGNDGARERKDVGFIIVWSSSEPHRVGEIALLTSEKDVYVLGRSDKPEPGPGDVRPRVTFFRQRPGEVTRAGPLESQRISREQLQVWREPGEAVLHVKNVGRCRLFGESGDTEVSELSVRPGDLLELRGQVLLMCVERLAWVGPSGALRAYPPFEFGMADAHGIVGESPEAWRMREIVAFVAKRAGHVLVRGDSGTGKELVARALHALSDRQTRAMVSRNAATLPEGLIDAELFGNARNYPNAGMEARAGLVGEAHESTLFLDEFAELPSGLQAHLLRVLDAGEYTRLGEPRPRRADFRLIAATNRPLAALKQDVLARLPFRIELAGLGERREDIPLLLAHVLRSIHASDPEAVARFMDGTTPRLSADLVKSLLRHPYTTHARELSTLVWQSVMSSPGDRLEVPEVLARGPRKEVDTSPDIRLDTSTGELPVAGGDEDSLSPARIQACLDAHNGVIEHAWRALGLSSRHALARLIRKHRLELRRSPK
ncbi:sigma 54-interacting transcriptional regulator [Pendulispora brunnea]|uniref:Sigma 54-interacting transcriptional regulator n=1 Tax=Pendulispora brunnea TaxID=2905690 RepID=A0ABZ2KBS7_9BACT